MLIRAVDAQLQSLPPLTVNLNESGARKILSLIDDGIDQGS